MKATLGIMNKMRSGITKNWLVILIFITAAFLRFFRLSEFTMFLSDQGRDAIILRQITTFKHFPAIGAPSSIGQVYLGPFYYYLIAPFLLLFNFNPVGMSFGSAFLSIIGLIISYFIVKKETDKQIALFFLIFVSFSSVLIEASRFSWNPNLLSFFSFFTLYLFYRLFNKPNKLLAIGSGMFFAFCFQLHYLAAILILPILIWFIIKVLKTQNKIQYFSYVLLSILSFLVFNLPLIIFDLRHNFLNVKNFIGLFAQGGVVGRTSFINHFSETVQGLFTFALNNQIPTIVSLTIFVAIIFIFIIIIQNKKHIFLFFNVLALALYLLGFSMLNSTRLPHYYGVIYFSFFLIIAYILHVLIIHIPRSISYFVISIILFGFIAMNIPQYNFLFQKGGNQIEHSRRVADFLAEKINNKPFNIATWPVELTEDNYVYFLKLKNLTPADRNKIEITNQMFVLCNQKPCKILDSPSWNISMFGKTKIDTIWEFDGITIYKLVHDQ
ncbi:MAG: glycosyltransferase family 39 protein [bacterium]|nr:glycosyltransferase family 39 protein [bacterium]